MAESLRVLVVEDSPDDAELVILQLEQQHFELDWERVDTEPEYLAALDTEPDLILADYAMPRFCGLRALQLLKERGLDIPLIIVSGTIGEEVAVAAMKQGARDYLPKDRLGRLGTAVVNALEEKRLRDEEQRARQALQESEEKYRLHFENVSDLIFSMDSGLRILSASPSVERMLGYTPEEVIGRPFPELDIVASGYLETALSDAVRVFGGEQIASVYELIAKDGTTKFVELSGAPLIRDGEIFAMVVVARDVTDRQRAVEQVQQRNRELGLLNRVLAATAAAGETLESILEVVCRELALAFEVPQAAAALFNPEKTEAVVVAEYVAEGRPSALGATIPAVGNPASQHLLTQKTPLVIEDAQTDPRLAPIHDLMRRRGTGSLLLLPLMVDGAVVGSLGVDAAGLRPFSDLEVSLARRVAEQVSGVLARVRLAEERHQLEAQFHQAQKMEAVGRLAGGVAHDFSNLLTVIHLSTKLLARQLHSQDPLSVHVHRIQEAGQRATNLTRQLLAFSRQEVAEPRALDLTQVTAEFSKMLRRVIGEDIELVLALADDLWPVHMDPTHVEQVVMNLVVNARDAMSEGGRLTIETGNVIIDEALAHARYDLRPGPYVMLTVSDTGEGMSGEVKARIFEPFFTTKEPGKGTGLGLSTVFGIVQHNKGHIQVDSQVGLGTTFKIYLPRLEAADPRSERREPAARRSESGWTATQTILVVEDREDVQDITVQVLRSEGYQVLTASNGLEAIQVSQEYQGPIHLLLTDVVMPQMGGPEAVKRLRQERPGTRVLYTSGYGDRPFVQQAMSDPEVDFLPKPFTVESLTQKVREVLDVEAG